MRIIRSLLLFATACGAIRAATPNLLPLENGNRWTYRDTASGEILTITVRTPVMHNGNVYYAVTGYTPEQALLRQADNGAIYIWNDETENERLVTSFERVPGGWWDTDISGCPQLAQVQEGVTPFRPADGQHINAVRIAYRSFGCADAGFEEELYGENIGLLRRVITTIAGPRTFDLVYAKVGNISYEGQRGNSFQVLLSRNLVECGDGGTPERVTVTMRLSGRRSPAFDLEFPSGQRYDIRLRNDKGEVVYQWSEDLAFPQVIQKMYAGGDLEFSQVIPIQRRGGFRLEGGYYTVEAWLATTNREFSGATRFFYSPCEVGIQAAP